MEPLFGFQLRTIEKLLARRLFGRHTYLALEQGLGKTRVALTVMQRLGTHRALVISPALGRIVWPAEANKWLSPGSHTTRAVRRPDDLIAPANQPMGHLNLLVMTYDDLSRRPHQWAPAVEAYHPEVLILDEAHRLGRGDSIRTNTVYGKLNKPGLVAYADLVLPMSGTPARNHVAELCPVLTALAPETITHPTAKPPRPMGEYEFIERYCTTRPTQWGMQITGSKNIHALRDKIDGFMIRLRTIEVVDDLPPLRFVTTPLSLTLPGSFDLAHGITLTHGRLSDIPDEDLLAWLQTQPLATARRETGMRKVSAIVDWAIEWLDNAEDRQKIILFGKHPIVLHAIEAALRSRCDTSLITGATPTQARIEAVQRFQTNPETRVFLGQIDAASEMITLTAANTVAIIEPEFVPATIAQAAKRAHRIGQTHPVLVHLLVAPGTLDARIARICERKAAELAEMFDHVTA